MKGMMEEGRRSARTRGRTAIGRSVRTAASAILAAGALAASAFGAAGVAEPSRQDGSIQTHVEIDRPVILEGEDNPVYVMVRLEAPELSTPLAAERPPVNLALVLDRSGSMEDRGKLEYAKRAASLVVDSLSSRDRLSIVEYDDQITVLWPSAPVDNKAVIKRLIDGLSPRGSTNLTGGMMRGVEEVADHFDREAINRVLLLSDGLANQGVTEPREIRRLVREAKQDGIRISTMGLGLDYNEDLMQDIAENAGGNYYYIEHPNQMSRIFAEELNTLFQTVARDVRFRFDGSSAIKSIEVLGYDAEITADGATLELSDFYAGESRTLLVRLDVDGDGIGRLDLGTITFSYEDVLADKQRTAVTALAVDVTRDPVIAREAINETVAVEATLFESEERHRAAIALYEKGDYEAAETAMEALEGDLNDKSELYDSVDLKNKLEALNVERAQMGAAVGSAADQSAYLKSTKQRLYQAQQGKRALYMLQPGDKGLQVERLQQALKDEGLWDGPVDGVYSDELGEAVRAYQGQNNLTTDGIAGPATMNELGLY